MKQSFFYLAVACFISFTQFAEAFEATTDATPCIECQGNPLLDYYRKIYSQAETLKLESLEGSEAVFFNTYNPVVFLRNDYGIKSDASGGAFVVFDHGTVGLAGLVVDDSTAISNCRTYRTFNCLYTPFPRSVDFSKIVEWVSSGRMSLLMTEQGADRDELRAYHDKTSSYPQRRFTFRTVVLNTTGDRQHVMIIKKEVCINGNWLESGYLLVDMYRDRLAGSRSKGKLDI